MRRSIPFVLAAGLALTLSACSGGGTGTTGATDTGTAAPETTSAAPEETTAAPASDVTLTIWVDETRLEPVKAVADKFAADKGVKVDVVQKNYDDLRADFLSQVPTGKGPDITVGANDWLGELKDNGVVAPVELGDKASEFSEVSVAAFTSDGSVYGLPYAVENIAMVRNTKLVDSTPAKWDDMITAAKKAKTKYSVLIQVSDTGDPYTMYPLQNSFGAPVFKTNDDGSYAPELAMGGDAGAKFAEWLAQQGKDKVFSTSITYDIAQEAFLKGESPYIITGPWMVQAMTDAGMKVAIDPIPTAGGETAAPFVGVQGFYVSAQSKNALLANDFLVNYVATPDVQVALYKAGGRPPALKTAADQVASDPIVAGFAAVGATGAAMPSIPEMNSVWTPLGETEASIISGKSKDPAKDWQAMVDNINKKISK